MLTNDTTYRRFGPDPKNGQQFLRNIGNSGRFDAVRHPETSTMNMDGHENLIFHINRQKC